MGFFVANKVPYREIVLSRLRRYLDTIHVSFAERIFCSVSVLSVSPNTRVNYNIACYTHLSLQGDYDLAPKCCHRPVVP